MEQGSRYIIGVLLLLLAASCSYFLCLFAGAPVAVAAIATVAAGYWLFKSLLPKDEFITGERRPASWLALAVYTIGVGLLTQKVLAGAKKYGEWDAWAIWNYHARFLVSPEHWRNVFLNQENDHPDYPLGLPSAVAFIWRLSGNAAGLAAPFVIALFTTLATPTLIFCQLYKRSLLAAAAGFFVIAGNAFFVHIGIAQYADPLLGLFFLAAIVCMEHTKERPLYIALSAACIVACGWIKNEGLILAFIMLVLYAHRFFARRYLPYTLAGLAIPLITWAIFRTCVLTQNDLVDGLNTGTWDKVLDTGRYSMILHELNETLKQHFPYIKLAAGIYTVSCILAHKWPGRQMVLVVCCLLAYLFIYVVTRHDLEWHLKTSLNRLLLQLMPAFVYAFLLKFARSEKRSSPFVFTNITR